MSEWQVISEQHESQIKGYWMAVHQGRVVWRGIGTHGMNIAYAIVSLNEFSEKTKLLMAEQYQRTLVELRTYRDSGLSPALPFEVLESIE